jgi:hypothetical protein
MGMSESGLFSYSEFQGGSPYPCRLRTNCLSPLSKFDYVLAHAGHMESCKLSSFDGHRVGWSLTSPVVMHIRIVYGPPTDSLMCGIMWKTYTREGCDPVNSLIIVANCEHSWCLRGSRVSCCQVISLARCELTRVCVNLSDMGDTCLLLSFS